MLKINEYFDGKVKSISFQEKSGPATVGVMEKGEYEFGTSTKEIMTVIAGSMKVLLPGENEWKTYAALDTFSVEAGKKFKLAIEADCSYHCLFR